MEKNIPAGSRQAQSIISLYLKAKPTQKGPASFESIVKNEN